jgi:hypothetical protein
MNTRLHNENYESCKISYRLLGILESTKQEFSWRLSVLFTDIFFIYKIQSTKCLKQTLRMRFSVQSRQTIKIKFNFSYADVLCV